MNITSKLKKLSLILLSLTTLSSCATIVSGTRQSIGISSMPSTASIYVDKEFVGYTPLQVEMTRKDNHFVRIELEGYMPYEITISRKMNGWVFGNIVFGGLIGLAVDAISGGIYKLTPEQIQTELLTSNITCTKKAGNSYIAIVMEPKPEWKKIGNMLPN